MRSALATRAGGSPARGSPFLTLRVVLQVALDRRDHLKDGVTSAISAIYRLRDAIPAKVTEGRQMSISEVCYMHVITNAGTVGRWVVGAKYFEVRPIRQGDFCGNLDQMRGSERRLASASHGISTSDVEVSQCNVSHAMSAARVPQHQLGHHFRCAVRRNRNSGSILPHRIICRRPIYGGGRRKDEVRNAVLYRALDQRV